MAICIQITDEKGKMSLMFKSFTLYKTVPHCRPQVTWRSRLAYDMASLGMLYVYTQLWGIIPAIYYAHLHTCTSECIICFMWEWLHAHHKHFHTPNAKAGCHWLVDHRDPRYNYLCMYSIFSTFHRFMYSTFSTYLCYVTFLALAAGAT